MRTSEPERGGSLTAAQVYTLLPEAFARWQAAGVDTTGLGDLRIQIANLGGTTLGVASGDTLWLDTNAAGWGWFVDPTPRDDSEFTTPGDQGEVGRMDLLTVLEHEIGHLLGHEHEAGGVMEAPTGGASVAWAGARLPEDEGIGVGRFLIHLAVVPLDHIRASHPHISRFERVCR